MDVGTHLCSAEIMTNSTQPELIVPPPTRIVDLSMSDGAIIRVRQYGNRGRLRLALSHGNGLAINAYLPFWDRLALDFELLLFDIRNHGESPLSDLAAHNWQRIAQDMGQIFEGIQNHFGRAPTVGVFHSLSAIAALLHGINAGPTWDALVLFDPPLYPPDGHYIQSLLALEFALRYNVRLTMA
jgi:pimeloyl-ACP methyl ester carboxylesterase